jgi:hypothetical protein
VVSVVFQRRGGRLVAMAKHRWQSLALALMLVATVAAWSPSLMILMADNGGQFYARNSVRA